jgi:hypothetical protein
LLTDTRFWIGIAVGGLFVYFGLPFIRGTIAQKQGG